MRTIEFGSLPSFTFTGRGVEVAGDGFEAAYAPGMTAPAPGSQVPASAQVSSKGPGSMPFLIPGQVQAAQRLAQAQVTSTMAQTAETSGSPGFALPGGLSKKTLAIAAVAIVGFIWWKKKGR